MSGGPLRADHPEQERTGFTHAPPHEYVPQVGDLRLHPNVTLWRCYRLNIHAAPSAWWLPDGTTDAWFAQFFPNHIWADPSSKDAPA